MIREAIISLGNKEDLSYDTAKLVMDEIMGGQASDIQLSAYLTALAMKGETIDEITGSAEGMRAHCIRLLHDMDVLEIVGTGGDQSNSFNISTTSALVISAGGVPVAKHGNRAASSKCGAADVLEALGVNITIPPEKSTALLNKINICFLFAQNYHLSMKYVAPVRRELGIRTIFNILGPLTNPAGASMQVMGVYEEALVEPLARVLSKLGVKSAMVVYGQLAGGTPQENAAITKAILAGEAGPKRNAVALNAGAGLYVAGKAASLEEGVRMAEKLIDTGAAKARLDEFIKMSNCN